MLTPYPQSLPIESIKIVVSKLRGNAESTVKLADVTHAGWEVVGFGLSQTVGNPGAVVTNFGASGSATCTPEELADHLEGCCKTPMKMSLPWSTIVVTLLQIILEKWLKS